MRDLILLAALGILLPIAVRMPFIGVFQWEWLSLMNPHRLVYGFLQGQSLNLIVAVVTLGSWLMSRERGIRTSTMMVLIGIFSVWITITSLLAPVPDATMPQWDRNIKTMVLLFMIMVTITTRARIVGLLWIVVISIGYFGIKGGGFMILNGGNFIVFGPPDTMIEDNNHLALALVMILPLLNYLRGYESSRLIQLGLIGTMLLAAGSVIASYSRGGLVALTTMLLYLWLKSRAKVALTVVFVAIGALAVTFMPTKYIDRISTLKQVDEDSSFQGRLDAWEVAARSSLDRPFGAGFDGPRQRIVWDRYLPSVESRAAHSIYFMVLGEQGIIGLIIYLSILATAWFNLARVQRETRDKPEMLWAWNLAGALKLSMVGYLVGGAALSMSYYDGFLTIIVLTATLRQLVEPKKVEVYTRRAPANAAPALAATTAEALAEPSAGQRSAP